MMKTIKHMNWQTWLTDGDQYLKAVKPNNRKRRFNSSIRYNLLSMALESYIMAILDYHRKLPDNHTYTDLVTALDAVILIDEGLKKRILKYENIQSICSIEQYFRRDPSEEDLVDLKNAIVDLGMVAHTVCA